MEILVVEIEYMSGLRIGVEIPFYQIILNATSKSLTRYHILVGGCGLYRFKGRDNEWGLNLGAGIQYGVTQNLNLEWGGELSSYF